ncbi:MAG TPA: chemotaxis protein CheW [Vicinamibacteria bacterium]|nr:chemotaxis protein CheW [Vicinamibacteria bacterium]
MRRAADLALAFDRTFSEPPVGVAEETEGLLTLRAGDGTYAVRLAEIIGLFADRTIVRLPSPVSEFLGVVGLRQDVVPVYSLRGLLGDAARGDAPRWLIVARAAHPVAFAFDRFEAYLRVPPSAVLLTADDAAPAHLRASVRLVDGVRRIVSIAALLETIEDRIRRLGITKEP